MKSILLSALAIVALATSGCALQSGGSANLCGQATRAECTVMSGDCNCGDRRQLTPPEDGIFRRLGDRRGMGLKLCDRGSACGAKRKGFSLFNRDAKNGCGCGDSGASSCGCDSASIASSGDCGCDSGRRGNFVSLGDRAAKRQGCLLSGCRAKKGCGCRGSRASSCGCDSGSFGELVSTGDCGCSLGSESYVEPAAFQQQGFGEAGSRAAPIRSLFGNRGGGHGGLAAASRIGSIGGCGVPGCGHGNRFCSSCLSKLAGRGGFPGGGLAGQIPRPAAHPYGGTIPHTAQGPGAGTGTAPSYAYPYYTTRGPRDFLMKNPPSIGY